MNCQEQQHNIFNLFPFYIKIQYLHWQQVGMITETGPRCQILKTVALISFFFYHVRVETQPIFPKVQQKYITERWGNVFDCFSRGSRLLHLRCFMQSSSLEALISVICSKHCCLICYARMLIYIQFTRENKAMLILILCFYLFFYFFS